MRQAAAPPEIIPIIDDDADASSASPRRPAPPQPGRRWIGIGATGAIVIAITYGVVSSAISSNKAQAPPLTTVATSSTTAASAPPKLLSPQFYVADPVPSGFTMHFAETLGMGGNTADFVDSTTAQLWATPGASADTGSWFVVSVGTHHATGRNAYRTVTDGIPVVFEHDPDSGLSTLSFTKDGSRLEITAFGWADRQLMRLVGSVSVSDSTIHFADAFFATDHTKLLDTDPSIAVFGLPVAWVGYTLAVPAGLSDNFTITVSSEPQQDRDLITLFAIRHTARISINDAQAIIGQLADEPLTTIIQWHDDVGRLITVRGNLDPEVLEGIARGTHPAADSDVRASVNTDPPTVGTSVGEPQHVNSGWLDGPWSVRISGVDRGVNWSVWWIGQASGSSVPVQARLISTTPASSVETYVDHGRTYVLAKALRGQSPATLRINPNGLGSAEVAFVDTSPSLPYVFAAYAFSEAVPFTAQILDGEGATIASWPET